jgi:dinuclear metal center YbgI/SA1388 family protein
MIVQNVITHLEELSPLTYAEEYDNVGLLVGNRKAQVTGVLVTLDTTEDVIEEALINKCNLIVSFHPIIFKGLKKLTGHNYVERIVIKAIKNDIAIYAIHTALDNVINGVNDAICRRMELRNKHILIPQKGTLKKLITYVPKSNLVKVRNELFKVGAGRLEHYNKCSFNIDGKGTFEGNETSNPTIGSQGAFYENAEVQLSLIFEKHLEKIILHTLFATHPYEKVAYEILSVDNHNHNIGMGMIGELPEAMEELRFLKVLKQKMNTSFIKHSKTFNRKIKKVAVLGGSGSFAIEHAIKQNADVLITADLKYHDFFKAEHNILLADIGHYESEQYTKSLLVAYLTKKIPNFAIILSNTDTNPIKYL